MTVDFPDLYAGFSVQVVNDGTYVGEFPVSVDGQIDFPEVEGKVLFGYGYTSEVATLPSAAQGPEGVTYGRAKRIQSLTVFFHDTAGFSFSSDDGATYEDTPAEDITTGFSQLFVASDFTLDTTFRLAQTLPYPSSISSVVITLDR